VPLETESVHYWRGEAVRRPPPAVAGAVLRAAQRTSIRHSVMPRDTDAGYAT
jgi:hypothetical protein